MQYARCINTISGFPEWLRGTLPSTVIPCLLLSALVLLAGCAAPFSDLQSAKTVGKAKAEITPSFSAIYIDDTDTEHVQNHLGIQAAFGMSDSVDFRMRFERITLDKDGDNLFNVLAFGPKIGIVEDTVALNLPVGFALSDSTDSSETWQFHPTLLFTLLSESNFELNTSAKALIPLKNDEIDTLVAFNIGMGISGDMEKWAIRPELGFLLNPGEDGHFMHLSIGLAVYP